MHSSICRRISRSIRVEWEYRLCFTRDVFKPGNGTLIDLIREHPSAGDEPPRLAIFVDAGLADARPALIPEIGAWAGRHRELVQPTGPPLRVPGGETCKNDPRTLEAVLAAIHQGQLCRHSFALVVGGGAVLDLVGFATATAHRGIPLIRIPTTSLAQADAGVGVKNAVNRFGRKNWLGTFAVPFAVINDAAFLDSLPPAARRGGLIEALKVALIRDAEFFAWLERHADALAALEPGALESAIERSASIHLEHIAGSGDPFESGSSRPLDFGHWAAHKLEQLSGFALAHGDAVALGMALDLTYADATGLLSTSEAARFLRLIERLGFATSSTWLDDPRLIDGLDEFREHLGGRLTVPMIVAPGQRIDLHEMDAICIQRAIARLRLRENSCAS